MNRHERELRRKARPQKSKVASDRTIYSGILLIGFFFVALASLFFEGHWREPLVLYIAVIAYLLVTATLSIYRGKHIPNWQQALARIPLRFVGFGTKEGRPLEAAHDQPATRKAFIVALLVSIVVVVALGLLLLPPLSF